MMKMLETLLYSQDAPLHNHSPSSQTWFKKAFRLSQNDTSRRQNCLQELAKNRGKNTFSLITTGQLAYIVEQLLTLLFFLTQSSH
jgi:hypothetical protein